jgi:hypothetical protein
MKMYGSNFHYFSFKFAFIFFAIWQNEDIFKNVISHAKEYVYFPSSEIYDGLSAVYDYAQNGVELKEHTRILVEINGSNER